MTRTMYQAVGQRRRRLREEVQAKWADHLASVIWKLLIEGEKNEWVSGLPPDASLRLTKAVDAYIDAHDRDIPDLPPNTVWKDATPGMGHTGCDFPSERGAGDALSGKAQEPTTPSRTDSAADSQPGSL